MEDFLNSKKYWDKRFKSGDWEKNFGREQSRFFSRIAIDNLPEWFKHHIIANQADICDWGCAEGDGTDILASYFGTSQVQGIDFSKVAIHKAQQYYPDLLFKSANWLTEEMPGQPQYDVIFSSNTLEHFSNPQVIFQAIAAYAKQMVVLMVPFNEFGRITEHRYTFLAENIQIVPLPDFLLIHAAIINTSKFNPTYWNGEQVLLIFARTVWASKVGFPLNQTYIDVKLSKALTEKEQTVQLLSTQLTVKEQVVQALSTQLTEKELVVQELSAQLTERGLAVQELSTQLTEKELAVQGFSTQLTESEQAVLSLSSQTEQLGRHNEVLKTQAAEKDQIITNLQNRLAEKELEEQRVSLQLFEKNQAIQVLMKQREERDAQTDAIQAQLIEGDRCLHALQDTLKEKEQLLQTEKSQIAENERVILEKQLLLHKIYTSRGFKLLALFWEAQNAWIRGPRSFINFSLHYIYKCFPRRIRISLSSIYSRFKSSKTNKCMQVSIEFDKLQSKFITLSNVHMQDQPPYGIGIPGLVSVVLPVYNQANLLKEAIQSVLDQSYQNFELIIINDGSTDNVEEVLTGFINHSKVRILEHENNQGLPQALNSGFTNAHGEFWTWTSADNLMLPHQLERHIAFLRAHLDAAMVYSDYFVIDDRGQPLQDMTFRSHNRTEPNSPLIRLPRSTDQLNLVKDNFIGPCFMYRSWVGKLIGPYNPQLMGAEDYDYWMRINSQFKIAHLNTDEVLYHYRVHENTMNARARELGIFERVNQLMSIDSDRRMFYSQPFTFYADEQVTKELKGLVVCRPLSDLLFANEETKSIILISGNSPNFINDLLNRKNVFVALCLLGQNKSIYEVDKYLLKNIDVCFAMNEIEYRRTQTFEKISFFIQKPNELYLLVQLAANEVLFRKLQQKKTNHVKQHLFLSKDRKLKVVLQLDNFDKGGLEQIVYDLATGLDRTYFQPIILVLQKSGQLGRHAQVNGLEVVELGTCVNEKLYFNALNQISPDIINSHGTCFGAHLINKLGLPFVQTIHNTYIWLTPDKINKYYLAEPYTSAYVCVSRNVAKYSDLRLGLDPGRMHIIENGINANRFSLDKKNGTEIRNQIRDRYNLSKNDFVVLCASAFYRHKGHLEVIEALEHAVKVEPRLKILFIGESVDREYNNEIEQAAEKFGVKQRIVFAGFQEDPIGYYYAADAFVLPSLWEGWSLALAEALVVGLPVIATDVGSASDLLSEGASEILVKPPFKDITELDASNWSLYATGKLGDRPSFIMKLKEAMILSANNPISQEMREKSQQLIKNKYSTSRMVTDYEQLYSEVAALRLKPIDRIK